MLCHGYRGYISSQMADRSVPQNVQQLVIRDYCARNGQEFLLSATEYCFGGTMMLHAIKERGIVFYSLWQLHDLSILRRKECHFAAENIKATTAEEIRKIEDIWLLRGILNAK